MADTMVGMMELRALKWTVTIGSALAPPLGFSFPNKGSRITKLIKCLYTNQHSADTMYECAGFDYHFEF